MKPLHVVKTFDPAHGGPPANVLRLATAQTMLGHPAVVLSQDSPNDLDAYCDAHAVRNSSDLASVSVPAPSPFGVLWNRDTRVEIPTVLASADIVHLHGLWDPLLAFVAAHARRLKLPYIFAPRGMVDPWSLSQKAFKKRIALALRYRNLLNHATFIHALNDAEAGFLHDLGITGPVEILPNGIFLQEVRVEDAPGDYFQERFQWPGANTLLFLGRLHWKKGLDILADAFAELVRQNANARLVVAGPDHGQRSAFQKQIEKYNLTDRVAMPGPIYGREKFRALRDAAMFVLPSRQEGFSTAILEALACETPVVISEACHFPEVATSAAGMIVDLTPARHAAAYQTLLDDPDAARRMGAAGRELVASRYTWEAVARRSIELYERHGCGRVG